MTGSPSDPPWFRALQESLRRNQELLGSQRLSEQLQDALRRNRELLGSQNVAKQLQESLRRNQELFSSQRLSEQLQDSVSRNQELLASPSFQRRIAEALRESHEALRGPFPDLEDVAPDVTGAGHPAAAEDWVGWLVALPPLSKLLVLNMLLGLLVALLNRAAAFGADVPPALIESLGAVTAVLGVLLGIDQLRDGDEAGG